MDGDQSDSLPFLIAASCAVAAVNQAPPMKQLNLHSLNTNRKKKSTTALPNFPESWLQGISASDLWGCVSMKNSAGETCKLTAFCLKHAVHFTEINTYQAKFLLWKLHHASYQVAVEVICFYLYKCTSYLISPSFQVPHSYAYIGILKHPLVSDFTFPC